MTTKKAVFREIFVEGIRLKAVTAAELYMLPDLPTGDSLPRRPIPDLSWDEAREDIAKLEETRRYLAMFTRELRRFDPEMPEHECVVCGQHFRAHPEAKTCSARCRQHLSRQRRRDSA